MASESLPPETLSTSAAPSRSSRTGSGLGDSSSGKRGSWYDIRSHLLKPDAAEALDAAIIQKAHPAGMNADAVRTHVIAQRIGDDDTFPARIDGGQSDNASHCARLRQFRVVEILTFVVEHGFT